MRPKQEKSLYLATANCSVAQTRQREPDPKTFNRSSGASPDVLGHARWLLWAGEANLPTVLFFWPEQW